MYSFSVINGECGSVNVYANSITVYFPKKLDSSKWTGVPEWNWWPTVEMTIDNKLLFSYDWLPIYNETDLLKCQDMLDHAFCEYLRLSNVYDQLLLHNTSGSRLYNKQRIQNTEYVLDCEEEYQHMTINIILNTNQIDTLNAKIMPQVQIVIDKFIIFDSKKDVVDLSDKSEYFLVGFILKKISKN
jgi:hypothetical protein